MNRHQVLTGACNPGENCYAVGSVEGIHFTAYAAGCNIVILAGNFERVQIIPGVAHGNIKVTCIDCSTDTGKIAASYGKKVYIFEPTPIVAETAHREKPDRLSEDQKLDYRWYKTAEIESECYVNSLSWNMEGSKLLTGGELIQIWQLTQKTKPEPGEGEGEGEEGGGGRKVHFHLGDAGLGPDPEDEALNQRLSFALDPLHHDLIHDPGFWECVWKCRPSTAVYHLSFSPDGFLFASAGKNDRLVKIWYEDQKVQQGLVRSDSLSPRKDVLHYSFVYIAHPRSVTGFTWRTTSKYMPRGAVANMLVTSCMDNVCRIWVETILPDDGLVELEQFDTSMSHDPKHHAQRHKRRFLQRLKTIRHAIHKRRKTKYGPETVMSAANLSAASSVHDFHRFAIHHNGVSPVLHFHLAGSINPETDIPLLPMSGPQDAKHNFRLHWLDNKELQFTMQAEKILQELHTKLQHEESITRQGSHHGDGPESDFDDGEVEDEVGIHHLNIQEKEKDDHPKKSKSKLFKRKKNQHKADKQLGQHSSSQTSINSSPDSEHSVGEMNASLLERLGRNIEHLLKEWQESSDMLFSIHPVDGSFLVWLVEYLDETLPFSYRQAQVSFSSRLPHAFPIPDASTMACNLLLYCNYSRMDIKSAMRISEGEGDSGVADIQPPRGLGAKIALGGGVCVDNMLIPNVLLVSKHHNGSLNQWQVSFTEDSKFQTVVSVAHAARVCGHRFRANAATCHPVLPLLLTTSHHNMPDPAATPERESTPKEDDERTGLADAAGFAFCSELILWQVTPVGPLSKTGGLIELARINSPSASAFTSLAWVPTLLPSTSLGSCSNSPSALFVASDGSSLRLYQAVIDARSLLSDSNSGRRDDASHTFSFSSTSSSYCPEPASPAAKTTNNISNMVSLQSSARPGCVLELETINDATADWQNIQMLHVFQEPLVTGQQQSTASTKPGRQEAGISDSLGAYVDLSRMANFVENFYLVVLERLSSMMGEEGSRLHMWRITISSQPSSATPGPEKEHAGVNGHGDGAEYESDSEEEARYYKEAQYQQAGPPQSVTMSITTCKVCTQTLSLPPGVSVISANAAAGHLSSASIYPACFAPYLIITACTDGQLRFWNCSIQQTTSSMRHENSFNTTSYEFSMGSEGSGRLPSVTSIQQWKPQDQDYEWKEWKMMCSKQRSSAITIPGKPITVSCAYSGRIAVAYRYGDVCAQPNHPEEKFINLFVAIYECESTGGSEWVLEDTIELKNIKIPDPKAEIELSQVQMPQPTLPPGLSCHSNPFIDGLGTPESSASSLTTMTRTKSIPSLSTLQSVRKSIMEQGNKLGLLKQKCLVQLDWVSAEDGSHILTVSVGTKILTFTQVSNEVAQASFKANQEVAGGVRDAPSTDVFYHRPKGLLQKSKSLVVDDYQEEIRWMRLRVIELETADGLPPLPMHTSWVRAGILVVGMDNEIHVYTQWRGSGSGNSSSATAGSGGDEVDGGLTSDKRTLTEANLASMASTAALSKSFKSMSKFKSSLSMPSFKHLQGASSTPKHGASSTPKKETLKKTEDKGSLTRSDSTSSLYVMHDFGLFEAARYANPVLPQYHPKQLTALLSFGKIRRVKAILAHLLRCIIGSEKMQAVCADSTNDNEEVLLRRGRALSVSAAIPDETDGDADSENFPDYLEISTIPPLPIYALLSADADNSPTNTEISNVAGTTEQSTQQQDYTDLFNTDVMDDDEDIDLELSSSAENSGKRRRHHSTSNLPQMNPYAFTPTLSKVLSRHLMRVSLPGLSSLDQMYLVALADTVAHTKMDFADRFAESKEGSLANDSQADMNQATESMDDCGLRFLLAMRQHIYLLSTLPLAQRAVLQRQGLKSSSLVWAFHSEATEELLSMIPCMQKNEPSWDELRQFGVGWWVTNINVLRQMTEQLAKIAFQARKDPLDSAIFYLAMKKKNVLWGLYRSVENRKMSDFFKNDFSQDRWRNAAKKNAFALLGKQMFKEAAAFFLLAGSLNDAVEVLLDKLNDLQLALVVCRLHDMDDPMPESVKRLLNQHILGRDPSGENYNPHRAHHDSFLRSMALWMLKDYQAALQTLLEDNVGQRKSTDDVSDPDAQSTKPNIFNFYNYLRTHPLLLRLRLASSSLQKRRAILTGFTRANSVAVSEKITTLDRVTPIERRLFFTTAHTHFKNGCPFLALEVLSKLPPVVESEADKEEESANSRRMSLAEGSISTGILGDSTPTSNGLPNGTGGKAADFDWSTPLAGNQSNTADSMDWSQPVSSQKAEDFDWSTPLASSAPQKAEDFDWSTPLVGSTSQKSEDFDWSTPLSSNKVHFDDEDSLLKLGSDSDEDSQSPSKKVSGKVTFALEGDEDEEVEQEKEENAVEVKQMDHAEQKLDIMAQQYKFIACLKVLMEELSTLATGFEVDGGQLRYQLYIWLEKEVEVLKILCNYGLPEEQAPASDANLDASIDSDDDAPVGRQRTLSQRSDASAASLHEVILADKQDLESKERRMARRKRWLKQNSHLLRTLASYCILQGSSGGGLASVHMELLLLLQELQQERPQQQLLSPLPFPTTLPLLSASLASSRTVIADPIQYVQRLTRDLLRSVMGMIAPPGSSSNMGQVISMRNLSVALSSCIYQCLCDSDSFYVNLARTTDPGLEGFTSSMFVAPNSHLMAGILRSRHRTDSNGQDGINTPPAKWPGVTSLHVLLLREKDEDSPKLQILLCESLLAVYVSLLVTGLSTYDPQILYRLLVNKLDQQAWGGLFGGGHKTILMTEKNIPRLGGDPISKQRLKFNMKVMGPMKETYKEKFVSPELSMITYFMTKPFVPSSTSIISYDSDDSMASDVDDEEEPLTDDEEEENFRPKSLLLAGQQEHCDPSSYSWCLMRFAMMRSVLENLRSFLPQVGIELSELPIVSPMLHAVVRLLERWEAMLQARLDLFNGPPDNYIPGLALDTISGMPSSKLQALLKPGNSPFVDEPATLPVKRLWFHLLQQERLQEIFLRYVYKRPHKHGDSEDDSMRTGSSDEPKVQDAMKVVHKEQDIITSFAINQANEAVLSLATQKELVELDIGLLLHPPTWLTDENEMDIESLKKEDYYSVSSFTSYEEKGLLVDVKSCKLNSKWTCVEEVRVQPIRSYQRSGSSLGNVSPNPSGHVHSAVCTCSGDIVVSRPLNAAETLPEFLVVHTPQDAPQPHSGSQTPNTPYVPSPVGSVQGMQTGRGTSVNMRRAVSGVRRIGSHPTLQYYLTGSADGCVRLWEWGHGQPVTTLRQPGNFPKVTKVLFNAQGNKCCVSDVEGSICLWQVGLGSNYNKPIMSLPCHNKTTSDFTFMGCSSLIATAGHSSESKNVCLWDTLLPHRSALVHAFTCHEHGSPAIVYAQQHHTLISGGRKGDICIFDVRQRALRSQFTAHDSPIKCIALDPQEEFFVTGSAEGDIKVWAMNMPTMLHCFPGEHSKNTFFRSVGSTSGVTQVTVGPDSHLFSCGVDGSIKFRQLPERETIVHHLT